MGAPPADTAQDPSVYAHPALEADVVMKGGVTSGVVYPGAIIPLAQRYRFRRIGGTSAGAIAAVAVAAAEKSTDRAGYTRIAQLPGEIGGTRDGRPFILTLFQPEPETRKLFNSATAFLRHPGFAGVLFGLGSTIVSFWLFPVLGAALALYSIILGVFGNAASGYAVAGVAFGLALAFFGTIASVVRATFRLRETDFGLCRLGPQVDRPQRPALTTWLHELIQDIAFGTDATDTSPAVLSFADLWGVGRVGPDGSPADEKARLEQLYLKSVRPELREIDLQMMTTNLSAGRPMRLPSPLRRHSVTQYEDGGGLLFDPAELARFFPAAVVQHLRTFSPPFSSHHAAALKAAQANPQYADREFLRFPIGPDLPVVVAMRMSLSFPILISALPLWIVEGYETADAPKHLRRVTFSDGGITSNFPIHFFDMPLPSRPTFGLLLDSYPAGVTPNPNDPKSAVPDLVRPGMMNEETVRDISTTFGFLTSIKDAMQNWRDNSQARLPGYHERIVRIRMAPGEGGLNLAMDKDQVDLLTRHGRRAGDLLVAAFHGESEQPEKTPMWRLSRFARYRTTMANLEEFLIAYHTGYDYEDCATISYPQDLPTHIEPRRDWPYTFASGERLAFAEMVSAALRGMAMTVDRDAADLIIEHDPALANSGFTQLIVSCHSDDPAASRTLQDSGVPRPPSTLRGVPPT
jgi:predicted acylesterase/phospholipase RssA